MHESRSSGTVLETLVAAVARRWRVVVPFAFVMPVVVFQLTASQPPSYVSSADVLLTRQGFAVSGLNDPTYWYPYRALGTQAELARLPEVAQRVVDAADLSDRGRHTFLAQSWVVPGGPTDVMTFFVRDGDSALAARLATTYAEQYISYRRDLETGSFRRAIAVVAGQLRRARAQDLDPAAYATLVRSHQQLQTALATVEANAMLVRPGTEAAASAGAPLDAALRALALGLVTGLGLAILAGLLDPRARSTEEVSEQLGLGIVGQIPRERPSRRTGALQLLRDEGSAGAEAIRTLRTNLELDPAGRLEGIVLVSSSVTGEGKSTTAANLAIALARAGRRVALVDLDLRRPALAGLFRVAQTPGFTDVVRGTVDLDDAVRLVELDRSPDDSASAGPTAPVTLTLIPAGTQLGSEESAVATSPALIPALATLRELADVVLLDSPPLLEGGDALALSQHADALLIIASLRRYRPSYGRELVRLLAFSPARALGVVVVGEPRDVRAVTGYVAEERGARRSHAFGRV